MAALIVVVLLLGRIVIASQRSGPSTQQGPRGLVADRCAADATLRLDPESDRDGQGLRGPREGNFEAATSARSVATNAQAGADPAKPTTCSRGHGRASSRRQRPIPARRRVGLLAAPGGARIHREPARRYPPVPQRQRALV